MMSRIYSNAAGVLIWLGDTSTKPIPRGRDKLLPSRFADSIAAEIKQLFQGEYSTRLWIVQEILLSPNRRVQWRGKGCIDWEVLRHLTDEKQRNLLYSRLPFNTSCLLVHAPAPERKALSVNIFKYCVNKCEDPRDKVYGFMGLVDGKQDIEVDYRKSVHEVYLDVVKAFRETFLVPGFAQWQQFWPSRARNWDTVLWRLASQMGFQSIRQRACFQCWKNCGKSANIHGCRFLILVRWASKKQERRVQQNCQQRLRHLCEIDGGTNVRTRGAILIVEHQWNRYDPALRLSCSPCQV
jgi:hypothetical protein